MKSLLLVLGLAVVTWIGAAPSFAEAQSSTAGEVRISFGINGQSRVGEWMPFLVEVTPDVAARKPVRSRMTCRDVDDQPVAFEMELHSHPRRPHVFLGHFLLGRIHGSWMLELLDERGEVLAEQRGTVKADSNDWRLWPATTRLIAYVGLAPSARSLIPITGTTRGNGEPSRIIEVPELSALPWHERGLRNLDTIVLSASNDQALSEFTVDHVMALKSWLRDGGKLIFWTGPDTDQTEVGRRLIAELAPGNWLGKTELRASSKLEFQVRAKEPLVKSSRLAISAMRLQPVDAVVALQQDDLPLVVRRAEGFGVVTFVALQMDSEVMSQWTGTASWLDQLVAGVRWGEERGGAETLSSRVTHYGYRDVAGQLRSALDQFPRVMVVSFTTVALLIGLFVLLVGPADYFLLRRWLKRPEWTWGTFAIWVVVFSLTAIWIARQTKPSTMQSRSVEIIDWDARDGSLRGTIWSGVFSPTAMVADIRLTVEAPLVDRLKSCQAELMGLPGTGLGGTESAAGIGWQNPLYRVSECGDAAMHRVEINGITLPVASSRSLLGQWRGTSSVAVRGRLRFNRRTGRLVGNFVNPLDVPLRNVRILYENWGYSFEGELGPGESIDLVEARERTAKAILTWRASRSNDPTQSEPWNVADGDVARIAQLMMFYHASGGQMYATLTHAYWPWVDFTDLLYMGCAVLVAELPHGAADWVLNDTSIISENHEKKTLLRLILPVAPDTSQQPAK